MPEPFRTRRQVEFVDTDAAGIAHFSAFYRWMESAETELLRSLGLTIYGDFDHGPDPQRLIGFPRVHTRCDYDAPARFGDPLDIEVSVERLGTKSVSYVFRFSCEGRPIATGRMTGVCCQEAVDGAPEPIAIPPEYLDALRPFAAS